jgi:amino acid transporter
MGVGAIVGGGILALAGVAFATTGPSAIIAFAVNGGIAILTAMSFAELASRFPESGGTYTYARKVLAVEAAFAVGWVVIVAGVLSMLSALQANLLAAASLAQTMGADRTLPGHLDGVSARFGTPAPALKLTALTVAFVLVAIPDVAAAGAVSSLIFLTSFAGAHAIAYLVRKRSISYSPYRTPAFPAVPLLGGAACLALGLFQALAVPSAGVLAALWLSIGAVFYMTYLAPRARVVDASTEGLDPQVVRLRGRSPVVLVPIANPASAGLLVKMARALAPRAVSRIQLLSVVKKPRDGDGGGLPTELLDTQKVLGGALAAALEADLKPEALITVHDDP